MTAPRVYDWAQKQWVILPETDVTDAVASGTHSFEEGVDIPIVDPSGSLGTIPAEHVQNAFKQGYRFQTPDDLNAYAKAQNDAIVREHANNPLAAFGEGLVKGGIPGATWMQEKMVPMVNAITGQHGTVDDIKSSAKALEEENPVSNFAGELTGAIASPITEALGGASRVAGEKLGSAALQGASSEIVKKIGAKGVGSALEGAYYGLHDGLNESALGDPSEIAETLMHHMGQGLVFGGVAGTALAGAAEGASKFKDLFSEAMGPISEASIKAARAASEKAMLPQLPEEMRAGASALIQNQDARNMIFYGGGKEAINKVESELGSLQAEVQKESAKTLQELRDHVKGAPKAQQREIDSALNEAGGDLYQATGDKFNEYQGSRLSLEERLATDMDHGVMYHEVDSATDKLIAELRQSPDKFSQKKANDLESFARAQRSSHNMDFRGADDVEEYSSKFLAGQEASITNELRDRAMADIDSLGPRSKAKVEGYVDGLSKQLYDHPKYGADFEALDHKYDAMDTMRTFLSDKAQGLDKGFVSKLKHDPELMHEFSAVMDKFPDMAPILQKFRETAGDALQQQTHLNTIRQMLTDAGVRSRRLGMEDLTEISKAIGKEDISNKIDRLRELDAALSHGEQTPVSKYVQSLRALGRPVPEGIMDLEHNQQALMDYFKIAGHQADQGTIEKILKKGGQGLLKQFLLRAGGTLVGATIGHSFLHGPIGAVAGAIASGGVKKLMNPATTLATLTRLEKTINKSYEVMEKATNAAIDGLTSNKARSVVVRGEAFSPGMGEKKKTFTERAQYLEKLADPQALMQEAEKRIGTSQAAPNINAAAIAQYTRGVQFLTSKLPVDPLAHQSIQYNATDWKPSDFELAKFERYADTVENPAGALNNVARGRVSPEEIEALQTVYPQTFKRLQDGVLDAIMKPDTKLAYAQKVQLGSLFNVTADVSMRPDFILKMQGTFAKEQGPKPQQMSKTPSAKMSSDSTEVERLTYS